MSRAYKNKKFNTDNYTKYGISPKYFGLQARRFPGSIKKQYCDEDRNGFADATFTKRRSEAVRKGTSCAQRIVLNPEFGPENLGLEIPKLGPLNLSQVKPVAGPLNLSSVISESSFGPSSLSSTIVKPAAGPTNLLGEPKLTPDYGPSNLNIFVVEPGQGPSSLQFILPPVGGPTSLNSLVIQPSSLVLQPWQDNTGVGGPILGMPTANTLEFSGDDRVQVTTAQVFVYTQTWGVGTGTPPMFRATFQRWNTNIPSFSGSTSTVIDTTGPWVSGRAYSVKPLYTTEKIN